MKKYGLLFLIGSATCITSMAQADTSGELRLKKNPTSSDQAAKADARLINLKRVSDTAATAPMRVFPSAPLRKKKKGTRHK